MTRHDDDRGHVTWSAPTHATTFQTWKGERGATITIHSIVLLVSYSRMEENDGAEWQHAALVRPDPVLQVERGELRRGAVVRLAVEAHAATHLAADRAFTTLHSGLPSTACEIQIWRQRVASQNGGGAAPADGAPPRTPPPRRARGTGVYTPAG